MANATRAKGQSRRAKAESDPAAKGNNTPANSDPIDLKPASPSRMQDALDRRGGASFGGDAPIKAGAAGLLAMLLDNGLPPRLKLPDIQWVFPALKYESMPKRKLLKQLFEAWRKLGHPLPRGHLSPDLGWMIEQAQTAFLFLREMASGKLDPERMSHDELQMALQTIGQEARIWIAASPILSGWHMSVD